MYLGVEKIILVMDNLNTHKLASLYKGFELDETKRPLHFRCGFVEVFYFTEMIVP